MWHFLKNLAINKDIKTNRNFYAQSFSYVFDVLPNVPLTPSEIMHKITYKHGTYELPDELPNSLRLMMLGN